MGGRRSGCPVLTHIELGTGKGGLEKNRCCPRGQRVRKYKKTHTHVTLISKYVCATVNSFIGMCRAGSPYAYSLERECL